MSEEITDQQLIEMLQSHDIDARINSERMAKERNWSQTKIDRHKRIDTQANQIIGQFADLRK
jgi:hypothetical protein